MKPAFLLSPIAILLLYTAAAPAQTYAVKKIPKHELQITGRGDDNTWKKANVLTDFSYPWEKEKAPATSFSALWDGS